MFSLVQQKGTENLVSYGQESTLSSCDNKAVFSSVAPPDSCACEKLRKTNAKK